MVALSWPLLSAQVLPQADMFFFLNNQIIKYVQLIKYYFTIERKTYSNIKKDFYNVKVRLYMRNDTTDKQNCYIYTLD